MSRLSPILLALALAVPFAAPLQAQQITTSHGVRTLPRTDGFQTAQQYQQAAISAENLILEILQDVDAADRARGSASGDATGIAEKVKKANAEIASAKAAFDLREQGYRSDLASFQQRQATFETDVQNQRQQAGVLEALPSAQRDYAEVSRLNDWATQLGNTRTQLETERNRLLTEHDAIEQERARLVQQRSDAEAKLNGARDTTVGQFGAAQGQRAAAYANLRTAVTYLRVVRERQAALSNIALPRSEALETATAKLGAYDKSGGR
jgi:hypothetical protein